MRKRTVERGVEIGARQLGMHVRHVDGRALIAHVDDADALCVNLHPQRHDVAAAESEHTVDAARGEKARDDGGRRVGSYRGRHDVRVAVGILMQAALPAMLRAFASDLNGEQRVAERLGIAPDVRLPAGASMVTRRGR